jgi:glycosyltransferase involved in cell wall biosynthesis
MGMDGRLAAQLEEVSARRAHVVVSTGSNLEDVAARIRLDKSALHAIPYPVRLPEPSPLPEAPSPRVTFVGRLEPRKGPEVLLRAVPEVLAAAPTTRFVFIGRDGIKAGARSSADWLRAEAERLGVGHAIEFLGQLTRSELERELRRATVCAFPSRWESFGNVVAEASAIGRPVVVSPIPPFRELVEDRVTGRIVPLEDRGAWSRALLDLLASPREARAMGRAGAARIARISAPARVAELAHAAHEDAVARWHRRARAGAR